MFTVSQNEVDAVKSVVWIDLLTLFFNQMNPSTMDATTEFVD